jgi:hypothetical protein
MTFFKNWRLVSATIAFAIACTPAFAAEEPNDLVKFLAGEWENVSFEISDGKPVKRESYLETMVVKDKDTLTITAHEFKDGKDLTKDMHLIVRGRHATLSQGTFIAKGKRHGNVYCFEGKENGKKYRLRVYTMGDKYVFHREIWSNGEIQQMDMSYLCRK